MSDELSVDALSMLLKKMGSHEETFKQIQQVLVQNHWLLIAIRDLMVREYTSNLQNTHPNPLTRFGKKCFSQTDEDGITLEIISRLGMLDQKGVYAEFGVGNGLENNTLILASLGWQGFWVGGEALAFDYSQAKRFAYFRDWITLDNILRYTQAGVERFGTPDVISLDLDGNDIYFVEKLLENYHPRLFIVEYNAKFLPPVRFKIEYNAQHRWAGDDYFGASISSYDDLFSKHDYQLVCCNAHDGANAFFVRREYSDRFADVPKDIALIHSAPRYYPYVQYGHRVSAKSVEVIMKATSL